MRRIRTEFQRLPKNHLVLPWPLFRVRRWFPFVFAKPSRCTKPMCFATLRNGAWCHKRSRDIVDSIWLNGGSRKKITAAKRCFFKLRIIASLNHVRNQVLPQNDVRKGGPISPRTVPKRNDNQSYIVSILYNSNQHSCTHAS